ncbi:mammalian cell entry protein [Mycolicibacterium stellerae]|uniref:mammalian cell entry protein n=1 Tax=Mycolicibacterium stellerae TaxID=2358193 RepID=UPI000F0B76CE|nr:mammalian cell entry protein [Mycolicibacterium stellerae]
MSEETASTQPSPKPPGRRRASRAAGPSGGAATSPSPSGGRDPHSTGAPVEAPKPVKVRLSRPEGPPPRRQPHRALAALVSLATTLVLLVAVGVAVFLTAKHQRGEEAELARNQLFVDTASQFVVNMFSYTQQTIDEDVDRFVNNTSGPLRDMMSQGQNTENLKLLFRDTNASAEAVVNGAALEKLDKVADRADVLVAVRVTVTDLDGNNAPSKPYRLRVTVAEDDNGHMSFYDLKYPDGGN